MHLNCTLRKFHLPVSGASPGMARRDCGGIKLAPWTNRTLWQRTSRLDQFRFVRMKALSYASARPLQEERWYRVKRLRRLED